MIHLLVQPEFAMNLRRSALASLMMLFSAASWSYGGGGGSSGCDEPSFFPESPAEQGVVASFTGFSFIASKTDANTLSVKINGAEVPPNITAMPNGDLKVAVTPDSPITAPGRIQIAIAARSKDGCAAFRAFYIEVQ